MRQLWIFRVSGGDPFHLQVQGSPPLHYDGRPETLLRTLCTQAQAMVLEAEMRSHGCSVEAHCPNEGPDQKAKRQNIMHVLGGERVFPCVRCPECAWFDPGIDSLCGAGFSPTGPGWEPETVEGALSDEKHAQDFQRCPLREGAPQ